MSQHEDKFTGLYTTNPAQPDDPDGIRQYFLRIIEMMPNSVYWLDRNCMTLGCNKNVLNEVGLNSLEEFVGLTYEELGQKANWTENQAMAFKKYDMEVMETGKPKINIEEPPLYGKNGEPVYSISTRVPLFDDNKEVIGVVGISVDVTELKKIQEKLALAQAKELVNEEKAAFIANMRHDFRTPLSELAHTIEILKSPQNLDENEIQSLISYMDSSVNRLSHLIESVVDFARIKSETFPLVLNEFDLRQVVETIVDTFSDKVRSKKIKLLVDYPETVAHLVVSDTPCITRILYNLISNAIKFTNVGSVTVRVEEAGYEDDKINLLISIKDTGIGISQKTTESLFEDFKRLEPSYKGLTEGLGIGLPITKKFVDKMGGEISIDSKKNQGTTVSVKLPFIQQPIKNILMNWHKKNPSANIMLVTDDPEEGHILKKQLANNDEQTNFIVTPSHQFLKAFIQASIDKKKIDMLIIDDKAKAFSYKALIHVIRTMAPENTPLFLLLTDNTDLAFVKSAKEAGIEECFVRPIKPSMFLTRLSQLWASQQVT